jgi:FtsH-binding integral membrane protein
MAWVGTEQSRASTVHPAGGVRAAAGTDQVVRAFFQRVYLFMGLGLGLTALVAMAVASSPAAMAVVLGNKVVFYGLIIAQLGLVVAFSAVAHKVSAATAGLMFFAYAGLSGVTFSVIFVAYTAGSIASTFFVTAGMFAALSLYGAVTKRSLDSVGSFAFMGLIGLVIASVVNIFLRSPVLYWLTTFVGVIVFTALTAYDTAKLRAMAGQMSEGEAGGTLAIRGALTLYLDFINLFLMLLRLFGRRR